MNRRDLLRSVVGLAVASALPAVPIQPGMLTDDRRKVKLPRVTGMIWSYDTRGDYAPRAGTSVGQWEPRGSYLGVTLFIGYTCDNFAPGRFDFTIDIVPGASLPTLPQLVGLDVDELMRVWPKLQKLGAK